VRLSRNEIEDFILEEEMFETLDAQNAAAHRQEQAEAAKAHTWVNFTQAPALTDAQLLALREAAQKCGRPLTDAERAAVLGPLQGSGQQKVRLGPDEANGGQPRQLTPQI
jgi:hypothetical protein